MAGASDAQRREVDGGARGDEALGQFGGGLGVGEHRSEERRLVVGGGAQAERPGQEREEPDELARPLDGEQTQAVRVPERVRPRAEPAGTDERRGTRRDGEGVPAGAQVGVGGAKVARSHGRGR